MAGVFLHYGYDTHCETYLNIYHDALYKRSSKANVNQLRSIIFLLLKSLPFVDGKFVDVLNLHGTRIAAMQLIDLEPRKYFYFKNIR